MNFGVTDRSRDNTMNQHVTAAFFLRLCVRSFLDTMNTILKLNHMLNRVPSDNHYGRNNTSFPFAPLRLCVRPFFSSIHHPISRAVLLTLLLLASLAACTSGPPSRKSKPIVVVEESVAHKPQDTDLPLLPEDAQEKTPKAPQKKGEAFTLLQPFKFSRAKGGSDAVQSPPLSRDKMVSLAVNEMPLSDFIHYTFSDLFDLNYVMESRLASKRDKITLNLPKPVSEDQAFEIVREILSKYDVSVNERQGVFYIWGGKRKTDYVLGIGASFGDIPDTMGMVQQIIPIKYADTSNLASTIPKIGTTKLETSVSENILIAKGQRDEIEQVLRFVTLLDRPAMRGRFVGMLDVKYWNLAEFTGKLSQALTREGLPMTKSANRRGLFFIPIASSGRLIFFASEREWLERVKYWAKILDVPILKDEKEYFIFYPQNSRALDLGESLEAIFGLAKDTGGKGANLSGKGLQIRGKEKNPGAKSIVISQDDVRIAVDPNRNALILYATAEKFRQIERLLHKLDVIPEQILLEATIAEVTLTGSLEFGVEWALRNYTPTDTGQTGIFDLIAGGGGLSWTMLSRGGKFNLALKALAQDSLVRVLSSPNLTVRDGKTASIIVGKEVPILTQQATSDIQVEGSTGIIQSVQYRSTGTSLSVTPTIHARGVVTLELEQSVTKAELTTTSDIDSPTILNRDISTEVVVGDGQTVVLGGMISDEGAEGESGVPFLRDIPLLGYFFKSQTRSSDRTELIIMITPRIIRNSWQIDEMREAIFEELELLGRQEGKGQGAGLEF